MESLYALICLILFSILDGISQEVSVWIEDLPSIIEMTTHFPLLLEIGLQFSVNGFILI